MICRPPAIISTPSGPNMKEKMSQQMQTMVRFLYTNKNAKGESTMMLNKQDK
jgi:hypothetical protein